MKEKDKKKIKKLKSQRRTKKRKVNKIDEKYICKKGLEEMRDMKS